MFDLLFLHILCIDQIIWYCMRISSLHVVEMFLHERFNYIVEELAVEVKIEYAEQACIYADSSADDLRDDRRFLFLTKHGGSFLPAVAVVKIKQ